MKCYICSYNRFSICPGIVRDQKDLKILKCLMCGLVTLDSHCHIGSEFYEKSGMHGGDLIPIDKWMKETHIDDIRRFQMLKPSIINQRVLDFGCGAGGFLELAQPFAEKVSGVELEQRVWQHWKGKIEVFDSIDKVSDNFDLITAFHVVEHLKDPRKTLQTLAKKLDRNGRIILEVPSANDALLTLYNCDAFQRFTYWSQHLFLFNSYTLTTLATQAGLKVSAIKNYQRYPISNHLHWLSQGKPGGHKIWGFLDSPELHAAYQNALAANGMSDTLIAYLEI